MDPEEAHWAADILDESDTLIPSMYCSIIVLVCTEKFYVAVVCNA